MADYLTVTCRLPAPSESSLAEAMEAWPVLGCQVEDAGDDVDITIFLEQGQAASLPRLFDDLLALGARGLGSGHFAHEDWLAEYRRYVAARPIGARFWIDPHPTASTPPPDGRIHLVVEPRQAFGTGSHESTQLVLLLLEELDVKGARVLDVGCGSGILAIAAHTLGAEWAVGFDIDLEAVFVARQTVAVQPLESEARLFAGSIEAIRAGARFDVILANLIPAQAEPMLAAMREALEPDGRLVLSGLTADQRTAVTAEFANHGLSVVSARELGEWMALVCAARGPRRLRLAR